MKKKTCKKHLALLLTTTMLLTGMPVQHIQASQTVKLSNTKITLKVGTSKTLTLKNNKKKTTWKIVSGKKYVRLKSKKKSSVMIAAVKPGKAKVQAKAGKKKYTCIVTVKNKTTPNVSESPDATIIVPVTQNPVTSLNPAATDNPTTTQSPVITGNPTTTNDPTATPNPITTGNPITTNNPTVTPNPVTTGNPTTTNGPTATSTPIAKNENDVSIIQNIIQEQRQKGATVSEDLDNVQYKNNNDLYSARKKTG